MAQTREIYNTLLISPGELKGESLINQNVEDKILSNIVLTSQEIYLSKIIGTALLRRLQTLVYNQVMNTGGDTPDTPGLEIYKELLEQYVKPYIKYSAMKAFLIENTYKLRNAGVIKNYDTNVMTNDLDTLKYLERHFYTYVAEYEQRLSSFICSNKEQLPEVTADVMPYADKPQAGETFSNSSGLWLGSKTNKACGGCSH